MPLYELEEGTSRKFYRIELHGTRVHLHWGRIDTEGEHQIIPHDNEVAARAEYQRQLNKRLERGYRLVADENVPHDREQVEKQRLAKTGALSESPRFLFVNHKKKRFAWVEARGAELVHAKGPAVEEATAIPATKSCASPAAAVRERDAMVAKLMANGYELETFGKKEAPKKRGPKTLAFDEVLEHAVAEDPYDEAAWTVIEDWSLQQDDPRADLVRFAKSRERSDEAQTRGAALPLLLGPKHETLSRALVHAQWRAGYIVECTYDEPGRAAQASEALYAAAAMRLVRKLVLRVRSLPRFAAQLDAIARSPCARSLRHIVVETPRDEQPGTRKDVTARTQLDTRSLATLVNLVRLEVHSTRGRLRGTTPLPLRELNITFDVGEAIDGWCKHTFPALRTLAMRFIGRLGPRIADHLEPLLLGRMAPALESLVVFVRAQEDVGVLTALLEHSPLRPQLGVCLVSVN